MADRLLSSLKRYELESKKRFQNTTKTKRNDQKQTAAKIRSMRSYRFVIGKKVYSRTYLNIISGNIDYKFMIQMLTYLMTLSFELKPKFKRKFLAYQAIDEDSSILRPFSTTQTMVDNLYLHCLKTTLFPLSVVLAWVDMDTCHHQKDVVAWL